VKKKRYLVTGGSGFIGSALVERLVAQGHSVRVLDDLSRGSARRLKPLLSKIDLVRGDVRDTAAVEKACRGVDSVCHLAFVNGTEFFYSKPELVLDVGVKGMVNVLDGAMKNRVPELVLASSSEVYQTPPRVPTDESAPLVVPDPWNPRYSYGAGKIISEVMTLNYGRKFFKRVLIFRPHNVFGPDMGWEHVVPQFVLRMKKLAADSRGVIPFPIQGSGRETRAFIYIEDFADGLMKVLARGKHLGIYHIGTQKEIAIGDVAQRVAGYFGRRARLVPGKAAKGGTQRRCPDIQKLVALGFRPKYSFQEGLEHTAVWYDAHSHEAPKK
jgi:nucleoside-diphosphate-sugar epimerase